MKNKLLIIIVATIILFLIGCKNDVPDEWEVEDDELHPFIDTNEEITIRILYHSPEFTFMQRYGNDIMKNLDHLNLVVYNIHSFFEQGEEITISDIEELIIDKKIDIVYAGGLSDDWAPEWLVPLDMFIEDPSFHKEKLYPNLLDYLRLEDGRIYVLSSTIRASALYYNKDLFDQYNIIYPSNYMDWEEVLQLASQFSANDFIGLETYKRFEVMESIARTNRLTLVDDTGEKLMLTENSKWLELLESVILLKRDGTIYSDRNFYEPDIDHFLHGEAAMKVVPNYYIKMLENVDFDWDIVTEPYNNSFPHEASSFDLGDTFSIYVGSEHIEKSWEIISYILSEEIAAKLVENDHSTIVSRVSQMKENQEFNMNAFYLLSQSGRSFYNRNITGEWYYDFHSIAEDVMNKILDNKVSVEKGLQEMQDRGQVLLDEWVREASDK